MATFNMQGYRRSEGMTESLAAALVASLREHPTQRLGQILSNATGLDDLFNVYDETINDALRAYLDPTEPRGSQYGEGVKR